MGNLPEREVLDNRKFLRFLRSSSSSMISSSEAPESSLTFSDSTEKSNKLWINGCCNILWTLKSWSNVTCCMFHRMPHQILTRQQFISFTDWIFKKFSRNYFFGDFCEILKVCFWNSSQLLKELLRCPSRALFSSTLSCVGILMPKNTFEKYQKTAHDHCFIVLQLLESLEKNIKI